LPFGIGKLPFGTGKLPFGIGKLPTGIGKLPLVMNLGKKQRFGKLPIGKMSITEMPSVPDSV
jgi:hypothetical protein